MSGTWPDFESIRRPEIVQFPSQLKESGLTIGRAIRLTLIFLGLQLALGMIFALAGAMSNVSYVDQPLIIGLINTCTFLLVLLIGVAWSKMGFVEVLAPRPIRPDLFVSMTLTIVSLSILMSELSNLVLRIIPVPRVFDEFFEHLTAGRGNMWQSIILLCVVAPITEEIVFRGLILQGLTKRSRAVTAILVSSFLFAVLHLNPWQAVPAFFLGILFGWWFLRTESLWPCLWGHALNNGLPALLGIFSLKIPGYNCESANGTTYQPLWLDLAGLALFLASVAVTAFQFTRLAKTSPTHLTDPPIIMARAIPLYQGPARPTEPQ
jgi:membrane protease YdiL (CAAX protease family)